MATASVNSAPKCSICSEGFKIPLKFLPCGHLLCLVCIEWCIAYSLPCPVCKQDIDIPEGGAKTFPNIIIQTSMHHTSQPKCVNHNQRKVDYYCNNCNVGLCLKCKLGKHKDHETLDIECDETQNKAIEKLQLIQNRITNLELYRSTLLKSSEQLKSLCEYSCSKVTEKTEKFVSDVIKNSEQNQKKIRTNYEENRSKVEDTEKQIKSEINLLESTMESNISPSTKTTLNILTTAHLWKESKNLSGREVDNLCVQSLQWVGKDFSSDQLGSFISKPFYIPGSYTFLFDISDIEKGYTDYYSKDTFTDNNLVWNCFVARDGGYLHIYIILLPDDNPKLNYCNIVGQISLLNVDASKTLCKTYSDKRLERGDWWGFGQSPITWSKLTGKNNGYLNSNNQFMVQFNIKQIREIKFSK